MYGQERNGSHPSPDQKQNAGSPPLKVPAMASPRQKRPATSEPVLAAPRCLHAVLVTAQGLCVCVFVCVMCVWCVCVCDVCVLCVCVCGCVCDVCVCVVCVCVCDFFSYTPFLLCSKGLCQPSTILCRWFRLCGNFRPGNCKRKNENFVMWSEKSDPWSPFMVDLARQTSSMLSLQQMFALP